MSHPNEDVVRRYVEALARRDLEAASELLSDDVRFHLGGRNAISGTYEGKGSVLGDFFPRLREAFTIERIDVHDILANDDHVVVLNTRTISRGGRRMEARAIATYHVGEGKITSAWVTEEDQYAFDAFLNREEET